MFDDWDYDFLWGQLRHGVIFYTNPSKRFAVLWACNDGSYRSLWSTYSTYRSAHQALLALTCKYFKFEILDIKTGDRSIY